MNMSLAARVRAPGEGAVGEGNFQSVTREQQRPELCHLFALGDRIGGDEGDLRIAGFLRDIAASLDELGRHIIERAASAAEIGDTAHLRALRLRLIFRAAERGIAEDVVAFLWIEHR